MEAALPALVVVVPLVAALLIALLGGLWRGPARLLAVLATAFSFAGALRLLWRTAHGETVVYSLGGWAAPTGIQYRVDLLNGIVLTMAAGVGFVVAVWMGRSVTRELRAGARSAYYAIVLLYVAGILGITITGDLFNLYVFLEIASITAYVIVGMGRRRKALFAGFTYLVLGSIGATFILLGIGHLYMATGSLTMVDIAARLPQAEAAHPSV
ncbi:MAG: proton-conducting transporter membrane subunit, partial [Planctomycetota bacterium]